MSYFINNYSCAKRNELKMPFVFLFFIIIFIIIIFCIFIFLYLYYYYFLCHQMVPKPDGKSDNFAITTDDQWKLELPSMLDDSGSEMNSMYS